MSEFLHIIQQPTFPAHDLLEGNIQPIRHLLAWDGGISARAAELRMYQRPFFETACTALAISGAETRSTPKNYDAFSYGFAAFEAMSLLVTAGKYDTALARQRTRQLFMYSDAASQLDRSADPSVVVAFDMAERYAGWQQEKPHTYDAVTTIGFDQGQYDMPAVRALVMGALIGYELQTPRPPRSVVS